MTNGHPSWRSLLYVPVNVPPSQKDAARKMVQSAAQKVARNGADVLVRINRELELAVRDIEASVSPLIRALKLPKIQSADHVKLLAELVGDLEAARGAGTAGG